MTPNVIFIQLMMVSFQDKQQTSIIFSRIFVSIKQTVSGQLKDNHNYVAQLACNITSRNERIDNGQLLLTKSVAVTTFKSLLK